MTSLNRRDLFRYSGMTAGAGAAVITSAQNADAAVNGIPVIPQKDTAAGRAGRIPELAGRRLEYLWDTNFPTLPGIPLAVAVPVDDLPTLEWLVYAIGEVADLVVNFIASALKQFGNEIGSKIDGEQRQALNLQSQMRDIKTKFEQIKQRQGTSERVSVTTAAELAGLRTRISGAGGIMNQFGSLRERLTTKVATAIQGVGGVGDFGKKGSLDSYNAIWATRPIPSQERNLHDDEIFAALRVEGANPMILRRADSLPAKFPLSEEQYAQVVGDGDTIAAAIAEKRLFLADYEELGSMAPNHATYKFLTGEGWNSAPIALFRVPAGKDALEAVAIQVGQDPSAAAMFLRPKPDDSENYWGWQMAKTVVQTADFNHHEMFVHLGRTHLVSEAFCVATNRHLSRRHPLNVLLRPHFEGDLWINFFAALVIMSPNTFGDNILAAPIKDGAEGARRSRMSWDFYENMPPAELAARGVDSSSGLGHYPYRDDALSVWGAIHSWADEYVRAYYTSDADVLGDTELRAWTKELRGIGRVKGFRDITSVNQLVDVVAMIMFTAGPQHAAVNYPQADLMTHAPFAAGLMAHAAPKEESGHTEADWIALLPSMFAAMNQMYFLNFLGGVFYRPLGDYRKDTFPYGPAITDPKVAKEGGPLSRFQNDLKSVESVIERRNLTRPRPYTYLLPSLIPTSTNI